MLDLKERSIEEFVKAIKRAGASPDHRYTMFLGAGCSRSSGIPTAGELVRDRWIPELAPDGEDPIEWAETQIHGFDRNNPAASYREVIEKCFHNPTVRQTEIERICERASPGFGYSVVAQLCAQDKTPFSVVLTTNFDDLVADAMFLYAESRPLVIHHPALAEYIRQTRIRPMVVKIHGDARLSPKNTALETEAIEEAMQEQVKKLLDDRGLLFFGYAGADDSVFQMLDKLPSNALDLGVYWVNKSLPAQPKLQEWLKKQEATWVQHTDFDEAMLRFHRAYDLAPPTKDRFDTIFNTWERRFEELKERIDAKPDDDEDKARLTADTEAVRSSIDAWCSVNNIFAMQKQDADAALAAYKAAVRKHPGFAPLLNNYANFLTDVRSDHDAAETFYKRAIKTDPKDANILGNYANFLKNVRGDHDAAETFYKRAIKTDPKHASTLGNYAILLTDIRGDHDAAETFYKRAIKTDPKDANTLGNYANLLKNIRGDHDAAETFYKRAIEADPKHANNLRNYAIFLTDVRGDHDTAETFYKRAIETDPKHANIFGGYAFFLTNVRGDYDAAEAMYKRAIKVDPKDAYGLGNYGEFLLYRGERDRGFDLLDRSDEAARDKGNINKIAENEICRAIYTTDTERRAALSRLHQSLPDIKAPYLLWWQCERQRRLSVAAAEDRKWLAKLIDVSEGKAGIDALDEWSEWQEARPDAP